MPLLQTKLHRPDVTPDLVCRPRLHDALDAGAPTSAALVAAPAGYGKSMLVSHWAEQRPEPCAWLSLDPSDDDLATFVEYLVAAVRTVVPGACRETEELLRGSDLPPLDVLSRRLVNDLDAIETRFLLVLDDLQNIKIGAVHALLDVLLDHPPLSVYLVLVTRRDPPLRLARLRAQGRLTELRLEDLEFDAAESETLLTHAAGVSLSAAALTNVREKLEGWAVGLRMVVLLLQRGNDPEGVLLGLDASGRILEDYLLQEVLADQSPAVRSCLLRTSILDRFCSSLCEDVCGCVSGSNGAPDGQDFVRTVAEDGLFAIPLDPEHEWNRYHHVFQRLLRQQLDRECDAEEIRALHARASRWFDAHEQVPEALRHALAAGDPVAAAEIVERRWTSAADSECWYDVEKWLALLPEELRNARLGLLMADAYVAHERFDLKRLGGIIERAEALAGDSQASAQRSYFRGVLEFWRGDDVGGLASLEEALRTLPERDGWFRGEALLHRALCLHIGERSKDAIPYLEDALGQNVLPTGLVWSRLVVGLAILHLLGGELTQATREGTRLRDGARRDEDFYVEAWGDYVLGNAALRRCDLEAARQHLGRAATRRYKLHTVAAVDAVTGLALAAQLQGRPDEADAELAKAREFAQWSCSAQNLMLVDSCRARIALLRGDLDAAAALQHSLGAVPALPPVIFFLELPVLTRCRILAATGGEAELREAAKNLEQLWDGFGALHYTCQQLEVAPLLALVWQRQRRTDEALELLERSLALATPGGWVRPYVEIGAPMLELLEQLPPRVRDDAFVCRIRAGLAGEAHEPVGSRSRSLPEELTNREHDVLALLADRCRDKEISQALFISTGTVKSHLKSLYRKLDCGDRRRAVSRARELGLIA